MAIGTHWPASHARVTSVVTFSQARCVSCDAARADGRTFSLRAVNRMFSFAAFFTVRATLCVIRYDHLAIKLGPDVKMWKFNHRLWTSIYDARICKRCSVNQTSFHIPTVYSHFSLIFPRFLACGLQCALGRIHTMRRRIGDRSAGGSVPIPSQLDRPRTRFSTKIGSITNVQVSWHYNKMHACSPLQQISRILEESRFDIESDASLSRACSLELKDHCGDIPKGDGLSMSSVCEGVSNR